MHPILEKFNGFIFDLDGTIYRGSKPIPSVQKVFDTLNKLGKKYVFVSNRTTLTPEDYKIKLESMGIPCEIDQIITSAEVTAKFLAQNYNESSIFVIGEEKFIKFLRSFGLNIVNGKSEKELNNIKINDFYADIVLVSLDRNLHYQKILMAQAALLKGAKFFAANIDFTCPVEEGEILDAGYTISALEKLTNRKLDSHFGKPSKYIFHKIIEKLNVNSKKMILFGDRLETDILMAKENKIKSVLVLSGVRNKINLNEYLVKPDFILNSVVDLLY